MCFFLRTFNSFARVSDRRRAAEVLFKAFGVCFRLAFSCGGDVGVGQAQVNVKALVVVARGAGA